MALSPDRQQELAERAERGIDNSGGFGGGLSDRFGRPARLDVQAPAPSGATRAAIEGAYGTTGFNQRQYDRYQAAGVLGDTATRSAIDSAASDYAGEGDSFLDQIGNLAARSFGFRERNPFSDSSYTGGDRANYGFDPVGLIGGAIGTGFGIPGVGLAADTISGLLGRPLEIAMGPDVFGAGGGGSTATAGRGQIEGSSGGGAIGYAGGDNLGEFGGANSRPGRYDSDRDDTRSAILSSLLRGRGVPITPRAPEIPPAPSTAATSGLPGGAVTYPELPSYEAPRPPARFDAISITAGPFRSYRGA